MCGRTRTAVREKWPKSRIFFFSFFLMVNDQPILTLNSTHVSNRDAQGSPHFAWMPSFSVWLWLD